MEWTYLRVFRRYHAEPVLCRQCAGRRSVDPRVLQYGGTVDERSGYDEKSARGIGTMAHTAPEEAGKVLALVKPRLAAVYHFFNDFDTRAEIEREIRKHYAGPLALAQDLMVFNVMPNEIRVRLAVTATHVWPNKERHGDGFRMAPRTKSGPRMSRWLADKQLFPKF